MTLPADRPPVVASRATLLVAFTILTLCTIAVLAGDRFALACSLYLTDGLWLVPWLLTAWAYGDDVARIFQRRDGLRGTRVPPVNADAALRLVTATALGLGAISLLILALGSIPGGVTLLASGGAVALLALGSIHAVLKLRRRGASLRELLLAPAGGAWLALPAAIPVGVMFLGALVLPGVLWGADDPAGYDVLAYHLQMPREWLDAGRIGTLPHNVFSYFPLNVEMHDLLAMSLARGAHAGMYLAQLMHAGWAVLAIAAVYGAARPRGRVAASVAVVVVASVPWTFMLGSVAYNEPGLVLYATLAAVWAMRGRWALAGACAGLAAGCKLTGVTCAIVLVPLVFAWGGTGIPACVGRKAEDFAARTQAGMPVPLKSSLLVFLALAVLAFSPWLLRTAIASGGNPVFPLAMNVLGHGHFDAGQVERFDAAHAPRADQQSVAARFTALRQQVGDDYHYGNARLGDWALRLWLLIIVLAVLRAWRNPDAWRWLTLLAGNAIVWLFATHLQGRFLVQCVPIVALLAAAGPRPLEGVSPCRRGPEGTEKASRSDALQVVIAILAIASAFLSWSTPLATLQNSLPALGVPGEPAQLRELLPADVAAAVYDTMRPIVLVGDARAFWYAIPSSRLRYRSVFDVRSDRPFPEAWLGDDVPADALIIVDPNELRRFGRTYKNLPAMPEAWRERDEAFVVR